MRNLIALMSFQISYHPCSYSFKVSLVREFEEVFENHMMTSFKRPDEMHDDVIKWKHFTRYWPFVRGIHRSPVNSAHKGQWCGALMFSLICAWINGWVNNGDAGDLRRHGTHYGVTVWNFECTPFANQENVRKFVVNETSFLIGRNLAHMIWDNI